MSELDLNRLATYNAEIARGIVHREDYIRQMVALQREYDALQKASVALSQPWRVI